MMKLSVNRKWAAALLLGAAWSPALHAQTVASATAQDQTVDEIIVTAERGAEQKLLETPLSVTAITGETLEQRGTRSIVDVLRQTPGASVFQFQPGQSFIQIRGMSATTGDATTGYYLDDLPFTLINLQYVPDVNLHGAMLAQDYDDCEADLLARIRDMVGSGTVIGVEFDLHCHLSEAKIAPADIVVTYKHYPHVDANARAREIFALSLSTRRGTLRPRKALVSCGMLGLYPTNREPLQHLVDAMFTAEQKPGILSISMGHGFPFGDVVHGGANMLVLTDDDAELAKRTASDFARRAYDIRAEIGFENVSLSLEDALRRSIALPGLSVIGDQSDNPGGGAPGDATFALRWALDNGMRDAAFAILCDPEAVIKARAAGEGAVAGIALGGNHGQLSGEPIEREWTVVTLRETVSHSFAQEDGPPMRFPLGAVAVLRNGSIDIIVSSLPCQCYGPEIFADLGLSLENKSVVVVKSAQHFTSGFGPIADHILYMAGQGAVPPDPRLIAYHKLDTSNLYPWNEM